MSTLVLVDSRGTPAVGAVNGAAPLARVPGLCAVRGCAWLGDGVQTIARDAQRDHRGHAFVAGGIVMPGAVLCAQDRRTRGAPIPEIAKLSVPSTALSNSGTLDARVSVPGARSRGPP